jgi:hypothetical protein
MSLRSPTLQDLSDRGPHCSVGLPGDGPLLYLPCPWRDQPALPGPGEPYVLSRSLVRRESLEEDLLSKYQASLPVMDGYGTSLSPRRNRRSVGVVVWECGGGAALI